MKRIWMLFIAVTLISSGCNEQKEQIKNSKQLNEVSTTPITPKEDIKVNKEFDEDGNLIRYDSSYTYFYSNIEKDQVAEDSIFNDFRKMFDSSYPFLSKPYFNDLFFEDSLMKYDFYKEDFFIERFRRNMKESEKLFQEMDSLKNKFFMEKFPEKEKKD